MGVENIKITTDTKRGEEKRTGDWGGGGGGKGVMPWRDFLWGVPNHQGEKERNANKFWGGGGKRNGFWERKLSHLNNVFKKKGGVRVQ